MLLLFTVRISQFLFSNFKKSNKKDSVKLIYYNSISQVFFCPGLFYFSFSFLPTIGSNLIHKLEIINYAPKVVSALRLLWYFGCCQLKKKESFSFFFFQQPKWKELLPFLLKICNTQHTGCPNNIMDFYKRKTILSLYSCLQSQL